MQNKPPFAFPTTVSPEYSGMTLRDYFAAKVITGFLSNPESTCTADFLATLAYDIADAMLKRRGPNVQS